MKIAQALIDAAKRDKQSTVKTMIERMNMQDVFTLMQITHTIFTACMRKSDNPVLGDKIKVLDDGSPYKDKIGTVIMSVTTAQEYVIVVQFPDQNKVQFYPAQVTLNTKAQHIKLED